MRKPEFFQSENKGADQLRSNRAVCETPKTIFLVPRLSKPEDKFSCCTVTVTIFHSLGINQHTQRVEPTSFFFQRVEPTSFLAIRSLF